MPPVGFEPAISAGERPQTYALDRAVIGTFFFADYPVALQPYRTLADRAAAAGQRS